MSWKVVVIVVAGILGLAYGQVEVARIDASARCAHGEFGR